MSSDLVYDNHVDMIDSDLAETDFAMASDIVHGNHVKVINSDLSDADMLAEELESKLQIKGETDCQVFISSLIPLMHLLTEPYLAYPRNPNPRSNGQVSSHPNPLDIS